MFESRSFNVILLGLSWCLAVSAMFVNISTTSIAAGMWAGVDVSTVPVGCQMIASAILYMPLNWLASRIGKKFVYVLSALLGAGGALIMIGASYSKQYGLLILGAIFQGPGFATAMNYRFAVAELVSPEWKPRAMSLVVGSASFAAGLGPAAVAPLRNALATEFVGCYIYVTGLLLLNALLVALVNYSPAQPPPPPPAAKPDMSDVDLAIVKVDMMAPPPPPPPSPILHSLIRAEFWAPSIVSAVSFSTMAALMTSCPVAMQSIGHSYTASSLVIVGHVLGMYLPAVLVGDSIGWLKQLLSEPSPLIPACWVMVLGGFITIGSTGVLLGGLEVSWFAAGLTLLGIGWAFAYVSSSALVMAIFTREPRLKLAVQGVMDTSIILLTGIASTTAGALVRRMGWVNYVWLIFASTSVMTLLAVFYLVLVYRARAR